MNKRRKTFKIILWLIAIIPLFVGAYLFCAWLFSHIPVNRDFKQTPDGITIYVKSNGVHTDIVLPTRNEMMDWTTKINPADFRKSELNYIAFGWGDKGFYLNTPTWAELKFSTAFKALFWLSTSAMHVTYYGNAPSAGEHVRKLKISEEQYLKLCQYINSTFRQDVNQKYELIHGYHYEGVNDNFYEAKGIYNLFETCNGWTNKCLKTAGVRTCLWAPFDWCILNNLKKE